VLTADLATVLASWVNRAACRDMPSELFYPAPAEESSARGEREQAAKCVCASCAVRVECLAYALRANEPLGIWGGMTENERRSVLDESAGLASRTADAHSEPSVARVSNSRS
jgi:WhiB family redox-sensing transcriptional regulator